MDTQTHPEDEIYRVKTFINELSLVQDRYHKDLCKKLGTTDEGSDWLFDYVYNHTDADTFEEYLEKHGKTFGELK